MKPIKTGAKAPATASGNSAIKKLGTMGLAAIVLSSMIGGGIFSLPQNMAAGAGAGAVIIAWIITGLGIFFIANTFRILSTARPDLTAGIYMYSREGFGNYAGFTIAWGYWLCQIFGNVGYAVITMDALNYFFPGVFSGGNNLWSIIGGSFLIWFFNFTVLKGLKQASFVNTIATICKILPLVIFIIVMIIAFDFDKFSFDFWGHSSLNGETNLGSIPTQIKSTMLVTLWSFIGIEGAVVLSGRAKSSNAVGKATILGFAGGLLVFVLLSILPFGVMSQAELAAVKNPSTAGVLEHVVGTWGAWLMNIGLIIAILASWLAWTMITAEVPYAAAKDGTFPKIFARENANGSPSVSLWTTSLLMQLAMILVYFSSNAWNTMLSITGVMVLPPYFASTAYLWKISKDGELKKKFPNTKSALICAILGSIFSIWLIYAAGLKYLLLSIIFLAIGIPFFVKARKENSQKVFEKFEKIAASIIVIIAIVALGLLATGKLKMGGQSTPTQNTSKVDKNIPPLTKRHGENVIILEEIVDVNLN